MLLNKVKLFLENSGWIKHSSTKVHSKYYDILNDIIKKENAYKYGEDYYFKIKLKLYNELISNNIKLKNIMINVKQLDNLAFKALIENSKKSMDEIQKKNYLYIKNLKNIDPDFLIFMQEYHPRKNILLDLGFKLNPFDTFNIISSNMNDWYRNWPKEYDKYIKEFNKPYYYPKILDGYDKYSVFLYEQNIKKG